MDRSSLSLLLFFFFFFSLLGLSPCTFSVGAVPELAATVHDALSHYGLPAGLFPESVTSFSVSKDGNFSVEVREPCQLQFDSLFYYDRRISGTLARGAIRNLKGVEMKRLFVWFDVQEITVASPSDDFIDFHVGWLTKKRRAAQFRTVRACTDGKSGSLLKVPAPVMDLPMLLVE